MLAWLIPSEVSLQLEVTSCPGGRPLFLCPMRVTGPEKNGLEVDPSRLLMKRHTLYALLQVRWSQTQSSLGPRDCLAASLLQETPPSGVILSPPSLLCSSPTHPEPLRGSRGGGNKACVRVNPLLATVHSVCPSPKNDFEKLTRRKRI